MLLWSAPYSTISEQNLTANTILTTYVSSDLEFVVVDLAGESLLLAKSAQPSSVVGFAAQNGASKGVSVEAAKGLEPHGLPVSMAVASVEPDSITSSR